MAFDLKNATASELQAKQRWYEARGTRFLDQIAEIRAEQERRSKEQQVDAHVQDERRAYDDLYGEGAHKERDVDPKTSRSVVAPAYRQRYASQGNKRGCGDWLHRLLDELCLVKGKLDVATFEAILDANSVKHQHWNRVTPGWQGRLRMSGRVALQTVLKKVGCIEVPGFGKAAPQPGE